MGQRKQFIAPNKCYSSKYQAATTLLIPLTITSRSYATANSDFKPSLPDRFSFSVSRGKPKKGLTDCCKQERCELTIQTLPKLQDTTTSNFNLHCVSKKEKVFHSSSSTKAAQGRAFRVRTGSSSCPSPLGRGSPADPAPGATGARTGRLLQRHIAADKVNPVINTERRSSLRGVIHNSYCTSPILCTRRDCLKVGSGNIRRRNKKEVSLTELRTSYIG